MANRKLRMGMIGGGKDAFIGAVHRLAFNMDGLIEICCGALSIHEDVAIESGKMLFLPGDRTYLNYEEMIKNESKQPADKRIDFVTIVTPNFAHFAPAMAALDPPVPRALLPGAWSHDRSRSGAVERVVARAVHARAGELG